MNGDMQSMNGDMQSMNRDMQSMNRDMQSMSRDMQSMRRDMQKHARGHVACSARAVHDGLHVPHDADDVSQGHGACAACRVSPGTFYDRNRRLFWFACFCSAIFPTGTKKAEELCVLWLRCTGDSTCCRCG